MSFTVTPAAARPFSKRSLLSMFQNGRAARGLLLPTQESTRMVWCGVLITKPCMHSTSRPLAGSMKVGCSQERFSSRTSLVNVGKNSSTSKNAPCCSITGKMVMSLSGIAVVMDAAPRMVAYGTGKRLAHFAREYLLAGPSVDLVRSRPDPPTAPVLRLRPLQGTPDILLLSAWRAARTATSATLLRAQIRTEFPPHAMTQPLAVFSIT